MRFLLLAIYLMSSVAAVSCPQEPSWREETAFRLEIVNEKIAGPVPKFEVRLSNLGPDRLYAAGNIGTKAELTPLFIEGLVGDSWKAVKVASDLRARCTVVLDPGDSLIAYVSAEPKMFSGRVPARFRAGTVVYHSRSDCERVRNGAHIFSFPVLYNTRNDSNSKFSH